MFSHVDEFNDLPEPARSKAVQFYEELLRGGKDDAEALKQAHALAEKWMRERVPGS
jgi:hypothetical protein